METVVTPKDNSAYVLSIDPGITTGVAKVSKQGTLLDSFTTELTTDLIDMLRSLWGTDVHIVIEDFIGAGPRTKEAIFVLKLIGGLTAVCYLGDLDFTMQVPQGRIPLEYEAKTRAPRGTSVHIIAAYAHALAYLERHNV